MKLFYRKIGEGHPLIILHGLFGQSDNWNSLGKQFAEQGFEVYLVDLRNHGNSPHSEVWNYQVMSDDIYELIVDAGLLQNKNIILLGHSMGGKVVMQFAIQHPDLLEKIIVADIGPKFHLPDNKDVMQALQAIDLKQIKTRKELEVALSLYINDIGTKQFLLKNSYWKDAVENTDNIGTLKWRFNLKTISQEIDNISEAITSDEPCNVPALFIRGALSNYILEDDYNSIKELFPNSKIETIADAGHWVHANKPKEFYEEVILFIK
jgi:pimeloyl-ACP methyl ester carboxylesterase